MFISAVVLSMIVALVSLGAGMPKALLQGEMPAQLEEHLGISQNLVRFVGLSEVAAAIGLVIGIWWHPLGIAAAAGLVIVFAGAVVMHARAGDFSDPKNRQSGVVAIVLAALSIAVIVTLALS